MPAAAASESNVVESTTFRKNSRPPKPNEDNYKKALEEIKTKIDKLQEEIAVVTEKIKHTDNTGPAQKRDELRGQFEVLRGKQADTKKTLEQLKTRSDSLLRKKRDLKISIEKVQVKDVDTKISKLVKDIESGNLKLVDEKKSAAEISALKKSKKTAEALETQQAVIDAELKDIDETKKSIDDNDFRKVNIGIDEVKAQLDELNKDQAEQRAQRDELFDERKRLQGLVRAEIANRHALQKNFHNAKNEYRRWIEQYEAQKRADIAARLREKAVIPPFGEEIQTCENLIHYFQTSHGTGRIVEQTHTISTVDANIRKPDIESHIPEGMILTKKSDRNNDYFVGGKYSGKKSKPQKDKKAGKTNSFQLPLSILENLTSVKVSVPISASQIENTVEELKEKKEYYIQNQERTMKENIEKAEAEIATLGNYDKRSPEHYDRTHNRTEFIAEESIAVDGESFTATTTITTEVKEAATITETE